VGMALAVYPAFLLVDTGSTVALVAVMVFFFAGSTNACVSALAPLLSEMFGTATRYTGVSMSYQLASLLAGLSPLVASSLVAALGVSTGVVWIVTGAAAVAVGGAAAVWAMGDTAGSSLHDADLPEQAALATSASEAH
jgi:MFS transporter, MHS family, shikimate and dehydroshikimate transport protein